MTSRMTPAFTAGRADSRCLYTAGLRRPASSQRTTARASPARDQHPGAARSAGRRLRAWRSGRSGIAHRWVAGVAQAAGAEATRRFQPEAARALLDGHPDEHSAHRRPAGSGRVVRPIGRPVGIGLPAGGRRSGLSVVGAVLVEPRIGERAARNDAREGAQALDAEPLLLVAERWSRLHDRPSPGRRLARATLRRAGPSSYGFQRRSPRPARPSPVGDCARATPSRGLCPTPGAVFHVSGVYKEWTLVTMGQ